MPDPGSDDYTEGCPGCSGESYNHNQTCKSKKMRIEAVKVGVDVQDDKAYQLYVQARKEMDRMEKLNSKRGKNESQRSSQAALAAKRGKEEEEETPPGTEVTKAQKTSDNTTAASSGSGSSSDGPQPIEVDTSEDISTVHCIVGAVAEGREYHIMDEIQPLVCDYYDEEQGHLLEPAKVEAGIRRELEHMAKKAVAHKVNRSSLKQGTKIWSGRWCGRTKGDTARMRFVVRQFRSEMWFEDAFCGTPDWMAIRVILVSCLVENLEASIGDFATAFMSTPLQAEDEIYVEPPPEVRGDGSFVWKLDKALNGLVLASKRFQQFITSILIAQLGFQKFEAMPTLFAHPEQNIKLAIHVDDPLCASKKDQAHRFWESLGRWIEVKEYELIGGEPKVYLGTVLYREQDCFVEKPKPGYIESMAEVVEQLGEKVEGSRKISTPGEKLNLKDEEGLREVTAEYHTAFRQIVGKGQFILPRRADTSFALKELGRRLAAPRWVDWQAAVRLVRYLWHTKDVVQRIYGDKSKTDNLTGYSDTDWAGCQETSKSSGCGSLFWAGGLIHFHSRTQGYQTLSSPEAEYGGAVSTASVMMFAISMLAFLGYNVSATLYLDASSAIAICKRQGVGRIKHLNNKLLWLQRVVEDKIIQILKVPRDFNIADIGTKHQKANELVKFAGELGLHFPSGWSSCDGTEIVSHIYEQFMRIQPSQRQALVKVLTTALMIRQVGST